jgi:hypothetical protein
MKRQKTRVTANQFDQALVEQIEHARGMNIPINAVMSAAAFTELAGKRLFGERDQAKRSVAVRTALSKLMEDARVERAQWQMEQDRLRKQQESRIILPNRPAPPGAQRN